MCFNGDMTTKTPDPTEIDRIAESLAKMAVDFEEAAWLQDPCWDPEELAQFAPYQALVALVGEDESDDYIEREQNQRGRQTRP